MIGRTNRGRDLLAGAGTFTIVSGAGLLVARSYWDSYDSTIMGTVALQLAHHGSITVPYDPFHLNSPHSFYGIATSLVMIPPLELFRAFGSSEVAGEMITNVVLLGLMALLIYIWARVRALSHGSSVVVALLVSLGGGLLSYAATGMSEVGLAMCGAAGFLALSAIRAGRAWGPWCLGSAIGAAILFRDDSAVLVAPWLLAGGLWAAPAPKRLASAARIAGGGVPFFAIWAAYNQARYGHPWSVGYGGVLRFNHPFFSGLYGLVLSPGRGYVLYAPVVLVAGAGLRRAWRGDRVLVVVAGGLVVSRLWFFAPYWGWYGGGGWGPRYLLAAVPALGVGLMEVIPRFGRLAAPAQVATVVISAVSIGIGFVGGAVDYEQTTFQRALERIPGVMAPAPTKQALLSFLEAPATETAVDHVMFDWKLFPIATETSLLLHRRHLVSDALRRPADRLRDGIVVLLLVGGGAAALLGSAPRESGGGRRRLVSAGE